jgi:SAM-dependent methyltransferase
MKPDSRLSYFVRNWLTAFVDPRRIAGLTNLPQFFLDWRRYNRLARADRIALLESYPCLTDRTFHIPFDSHYFYQGWWAAGKLVESAPVRHVDIGSSVMMIGILSALVPTVYIDYRPLKAKVRGLTSMAGDLLALPFADRSIHSLSCLHVIEHVGLGRYGDALDPEGSFKAAGEIIRVLAPGGRLLFSTPVGRERVQFNAHRVFLPQTVLSMFAQFKLVHFSMVDDEGMFYIGAALTDAIECEYACGMFEFEKTIEPSHPALVRRP